MNPTSIAHYVSRHPFKSTLNESGLPFGLVTCPVRLAYVYFNPDKMREKMSGKKCFSAILLIPDTADMAPLQAELGRVALERWGAQASAMAQSGLLKWCFKPQARMQKKDKNTKVPLANPDGTPKMPDGFNTTGMFLEAESNFLPKFWTDTKQPIAELDGQKVFYAGCWAIAHLRFWAYPRAGEVSKGNQGVGCSLVDLQFLAHDDKLGGEIGSDGRNLGVIAHDSAVAAANANAMASPMPGMMPPAMAPAAAPAYAPPANMGALASMPSPAMASPAPAPAYAPAVPPNPAGAFAGAFPGMPGR